MNINYVMFKFKVWGFILHCASNLEFLKFLKSRLSSAVEFHSSRMKMYDYHSMEM